MLFETIVREAVHALAVTVFDKRIFDLATEILVLIDNPDGTLNAQSEYQKYGGYFRWIAAHTPENPMKIVSFFEKAAESLVVDHISKILNQSGLERTPLHFYELLHAGINGKNILDWDTWAQKLSSDTRYDWNDAAETMISMGMDTLVLHISELSHRIRTTLSSHLSEKEIDIFFKENPFLGLQDMATKKIAKSLEEAVRESIKKCFKRILIERDMHFRNYSHQNLARFFGMYYPIERKEESINTFPRKFEV